MSKSTITKEQLTEDGWIMSEEKPPPTFLFEKKIANRNPLNNSEDSDISLVVHGMYNVWTFAISLPNGGLLNFSANDIQELREFENRIDFYDPPF